jgi:hypothetical protein
MPLGPPTSTLRAPPARNRLRNISLLLYGRPVCRDISPTTGMPTRQDYAMEIRAYMFYLAPDCPRRTLVMEQHPDVPTRPRGCGDIRHGSPTLWRNAIGNRNLGMGRGGGPPGIQFTTSA